MLMKEIFFQGVESENCPSFSASLKAKKAVYTESLSTLADGKNYCVTCQKKITTVGSGNIVLKRCYGIVMHLRLSLKFKKNSKNINRSLTKKKSCV